MPCETRCANALDPWLHSPLTLKLWLGSSAGLLRDCVRQSWSREQSYWKGGHPPAAPVVLLWVRKWCLWRQMASYEEKTLFPIKTPMVIPKTHPREPCGSKCFSHHPVTLPVGSACWGGQWTQPAPTRPESPAAARQVLSEITPNLLQFLSEITTECLTVEDSVALRSKKSLQITHYCFVIEAKILFFFQGGVLSSTADVKAH